MKENRFQERFFILDVFENVEQEEDVITFAEIRIAVEYVVAIAGLAGCDRILQGVLIQIEPIHIGLVALLELLLHQSTPTANFSNFFTAPVEAVSQLAQNIETAL